MKSGPVENEEVRNESNGRQRFIDDIKNARESFQVAEHLTWQGNLPEFCKD